MDGRVVAKPGVVDQAVYSAEGVKCRFDGPLSKTIREGVSDDRCRLIPAGTELADGLASLLLTNICYDNFGAFGC